MNQHYRNRLRQQTEEEMPSAMTVTAGLEFLKEHEKKDNWFLTDRMF